MGLRRTSHAVYDSQYPLVWAPKYRKWILRGDLRAYVGKLFHRIAEDFGFDISRKGPYSWICLGMGVVNAPPFGRGGLLRVFCPAIIGSNSARSFSTRSSATPYRSA